MKIKSILLLLINSLLFQFIGTAQERLSYQAINPKHNNGLNGFAIGQIELDNVGNRYVYGSYDNAKGNDFDGLMAESNFVRYLASYDTNGVINWVKGVTDARHRSSEMATNGNGFTWIAAEFFKDVRVEETDLKIQGAPLSGHDDLFLVRYDNAGSAVALVQIESFESREILLDLETDEVGNAYVLYVTDAKSGMYDLDLNSPNRFVLVMAKFSPTGAFIYAEKLAELENDLDDVAIELHPDGWISGAGAAGGSSVYIDGKTIAPKESYFFRWSPTEGFIASGKIKEETQTPIQVKIRDIALDLEGNIFYIGATEVGKLSSTGSLLWQIDGRHTGTFQSDNRYLKTDLDGNAYITGTTRGGWPTLGSRLIPCDLRTNSQTFTTKINSSGHHLWSICNSVGAPNDLILLDDQTILLLKNEESGNASSLAVLHYTNPNLRLTISSNTSYCELDSMEINFDGTGIPTGQYLLQISDSTGNFPRPLDAITSFSVLAFPSTLTFKLPLRNSFTAGNSFVLRVVRENLSTNLSIPFVVNPTPEMKFDRRMEDACTGSELDLNVNQGGLLPDRVEWEARDSIIVHPNLITATLHDIGRNQTVFAHGEMESTGCRNTDSVVINHYDYSVNILGPDSTYEEPIIWSANISEQAILPLTYEWTDSYFGRGSTTDTYEAMYNAVGYADIYLKTTDKKGCIRSDTSTFLSIIPVTLRGLVVDHTNSLPLGNTFVEIYGLGPSGIAPQLVDTLSTDDRGFFTKVVNGFAEYIVRIIPDELVYPGNLPTYYDKTLFIQEASPIPFVRFNQAYPIINAVSATAPTDSLGDGTIVAYVREGTHGKNAGMVAGLKIWLANAQKQPIQLAETDEFGYLEFTNLPIGEYFFLCDRFGIDNSKAPRTKLEDTTLEQELNFLLFPDVLNLSNATVSIEEPFDKFVLKVYPNPGQNNIYFTVPSGFSPIQFSLIDISGRTIHSGKLLPGQQVLSLPTIPKGLYTITLLDDNSQHLISKWIAY